MSTLKKIKVINENLLTKSTQPIGLYYYIYYNVPETDSAWEGFGGFTKAVCFREHTMPYDPKIDTKYKNEVDYCLEWINYIKKVLGKDKWLNNMTRRMIQDVKAALDGNGSK